MQEITNFSDQTYLYPEENSLEINDIIYRNVHILSDILKQQFPPFTTRTTEGINGYTTPYIEIMLETIREEGLSPENQSKKDVLTDIIVKKMADRSLKESVNLASAMATLIRMPESQNGRTRKG